ncbi:MAG: hypothetical protein H6657_15285 [Ardenticatenaceae bacterium]|nr:hypothetical protein [Ardenticatenaceae bacterium]
MSENNSDLTIGPSDMMKQVQQQYPFLSPYGAAQAVNYMLQEAAQLMEQGGIFGVLLPGPPPRFIAIEPIQSQNGSGQS